MPSPEQIEEWMEDGAEEFFPLPHLRKDAIRLIMEGERAYAEERMIEESGFLEKYTFIYGMDTGTAGVSLVLSAMGALSISSCSGHFRNANIAFVAEENVAKEVRRLSRGADFVNDEFYADPPFPCYVLGYDVETVAEGRGKLIGLAEKLLKSKLIDDSLAYTSPLF